MTRPRWFSALLTLLIGLFRPLRAFGAWIGRLRADPGAPYRHGPGTWVLPRVPEECPDCGGALVHCAAKNEYVCAGVVGRAEVARRLQPRTRLSLARVTETPPCGFHGAAGDYGTTWA